MEGKVGEFIEFLDFELPGPNAGGLSVMLFDARKGENIPYSFSSLIYAIRCMIHENENQNADEGPEYHVLLDWNMDLDDPCGAILSAGNVTLNAPATWMRLREVITKFVWGLEAITAFELKQSFSMSLKLGDIRSDVPSNLARDD